ncbi:MAG: YDG/SRA domain-containing protein [Mycobacterium sp.]|uniref:YDG/SRA domain-containing protein n=1 Tax=Mycobacterium sp. TaxID=1785 RepID=UPI003F9EA198
MSTPRGSSWTIQDWQSGSDHYVDDQNYGDVIIYTGQGGRDPNTGRQIADQQLTRGNLGLARSHLDGLPVRVIRGYEGGSVAKISASRILSRCVSVGSYPF